MKAPISLRRCRTLSLEPDKVCLRSRSQCALSRDESWQLGTMASTHELDSAQVRKSGSSGRNSGSKAIFWRSLNCLIFVLPFSVFLLIARFQTIVYPFVAETNDGIIIRGKSSYFSRKRVTTTYFSRKRVTVTKKTPNAKVTESSNVSQPFVRGGANDFLKLGQEVKIAANSSNLERAGIQSLSKKKKKIAPIIPPRPDSLRPDATFASCILVKDDNVILGEWLAYHYHTLRLRSLVIAVDPHSEESPSGILNPWKNLTNLSIVEWRDEDYMPSSFLKSQQPPPEFMLSQNNFSYPSNITFPLSNETLLIISSHRFRQRVFLTRCMEYLIREARDDVTKPSWLMHVDTDEYIVPSKKWREQGQGMRSPSIGDEKATNALVTESNATQLTINTTNSALLEKIQAMDMLQPLIEKEGSLLRFVQYVASNLPQESSYPCISLRRVLFGSLEDTNANTLQQKLVSSNFNATQFDTLQWHHHSNPRDLILNGNPKVILDLLAIPEKHFKSKDNKIVFSIHRPVLALCRRNDDTDYDKWYEQPLAVNHYLGPYDRYSFRQDARRTRSVYDAKAAQKYGHDDYIQHWLSGFVRNVGLRKAINLLGTHYLSSKGLKIMNDDR